MKQKIQEFFSNKQKLKWLAIIVGVLFVVMIVLIVIGASDEQTGNKGNEQGTTSNGTAQGEDTIHNVREIVVGDAKYEYNQKNKTAKMLWYNTSSDKVVIPSTVEIAETEYTIVALAENIFKEFTTLKEITIPNTVTIIGNGAFKDCTHLTKVQLSEGLKDLSDSLFEGCKHLVSITIPESVSEVGDRTFYGCDVLKEVVVKGTIQKVGESAFAYCPKLYWVDNLPPRIQMPENTFEKTPFGKDEIGSVTIGEFSYSYNITKKTAKAARWDGEVQAHISMPDEITIEGEVYPVTELASNLFEECTWLVSIKLSENVTLIPHFCFKGCSNLEEVDFPNNLITVGDSAFELCERLKKVVLPKGVTALEDRSFQRCYALESVELPEGITTIGESAFQSDENLSELKLPDSITTIGYGAFSYCSSLKQLTFPDKLTEISSSMCSSCGGLETVILPEGIEQIGGYAFSQCDNLTSINIPGSVKSIGKKAFEKCPSLSNVSLPEGVEVASDAFDNTEEEKWISLTHEELKYVVNYEKGVAHVVGIVLANYMSADIVVPGELRINGVTVTVTEIRTGAFRNREDILTVTVSEGILRIHEKAFENCVSLRSAKLPFSLTQLGDRAFANCKSLMKVEIPGNTKLGSDVFIGCHENLIMY